MSRKRSLNFVTVDWLTKIKTDRLMPIFNQPSEIDQSKMFCAGRPK
jgi:hypothetical protein